MARSEERKILLRRLEAAIDASRRAQEELLEAVHQLLLADKGVGVSAAKASTIPSAVSRCHYLNTKQAGEMLDLSPHTLEKWRWAGGGPPYVKMGSHVVYDEKELEAWIATRRRRSTSDPGPKLS